MSDLKPLSRLPRWMHGLYAFIAGYFWLPCPDCGRMFGGHEDWLGMKPTDRQGVYQGVCRDCSADYELASWPTATRRRLDAWVRNADAWVRDRRWYAAFNRWANRR